MAVLGMFWWNSENIENSMLLDIFQSFQNFDQMAVLGCFVEILNKKKWVLGNPYLLSDLRKPEFCSKKCLSFGGNLSFGPNVQKKKPGLGFYEVSFVALSVNLYQ